MKTGLTAAGNIVVSKVTTAAGNTFINFIRGQGTPTECEIQVEITGLDDPSTIGTILSTIGGTLVAGKLVDTDINAVEAKIKDRSFLEGMKAVWEESDLKAVRQFNAKNEIVTRSIIRDAHAEEIVGSISGRTIGAGSKLIVHAVSTAAPTSAPSGGKGTGKGATTKVINVTITSKGKGTGKGRITIQPNKEVEIVAIQDTSTHKAGTKYGI